MSERQRASAERARELAGNRPLVLDDPGAAWIVEAGAVYLFAVPAERGVPVGGREYLGQVGPGDAVFGMDASASEVVLVAVGRPETSLASLGDGAGGAPRRRLGADAVVGARSGRPRRRRAHRTGRHRRRHGVPTDGCPAVDRRRGRGVRAARPAPARSSTRPRASCPCRRRRGCGRPDRAGSCPPTRPSGPDGVAAALAQFHRAALSALGAHVDDHRRRAGRPGAGPAGGGRRPPRRRPARAAGLLRRRRPGARRSRRSRRGCRSARRRLPRGGRRPRCRDRGAAGLAGRQPRSARRHRPRLARAHAPGHPRRRLVARRQRTAARLPRRHRRAGRPAAGVGHGVPPRRPDDRGPDPGHGRRRGVAVGRRLHDVPIVPGPPARRRRPAALRAARRRARRRDDRGDGRARRAAGPRRPDRHRAALQPFIPRSDRRRRRAGGRGDVRQRARHHRLPADPLDRRRPPRRPARPVAGGGGLGSPPRPPSAVLPAVRVR